MTHSTPDSAAACPGLEADVRDDMQAVALHYLRGFDRPASDRDLACMGFTQGQIAAHAVGVRSAAARQHALELKNGRLGT